MAICKYFLEGYCKFGDRCKFKHVYYDNKDNYYGYDDQNNYTDNNYNGRNQTRPQSSKPFSGVSILRSGRNDNPSFTPIQNSPSNYNPNANQQVSNFPVSSGFTSYIGSNYNRNRSNNQAINPPSELVKNVLSLILKEIDTAENGHQWPLTSFCPINKEAVNIPGWVDHSPEELRYEVYKALQDGTFEQCKASIQQLIREAEERKNDFKNREKAVALTESLLEMKRNDVTKTTSNSFSNTNTNNDFNTSNSNFSNFNQAVESRPAFSTPSVLQPQSQSFISSFQNVQPSVNTSSQSRLFMDPAPAPAPAFSLVSAQTSAASHISLPFTPSLFTSNQGNNNSTLFTSTSIAVNKDTNPNDYTCENNFYNYSILSQLTEQEIVSYQADKFKFGQIPTKPPPKELCGNQNPNRQS